MPVASGDRDSSAETPTTTTPKPTLTPTPTPRRDADVRAGASGHERRPATAAAFRRRPSPTRLARARPTPAAIAPPRATPSASPAPAPRPTPKADRNADVEADADTDADAASAARGHAADTAARPRRHRHRLRARPRRHRRRSPDPRRRHRLRRFLRRRDRHLRRRRPLARRPRRRPHGPPHVLAPDTRVAAGGCCADAITVRRAVGPRWKRITSAWRSTISASAISTNALAQYRRAARTKRRERRGPQQPGPAVSGSRPVRRRGEAVSARDRHRAAIRQGAQQSRASPSCAADRWSRPPPSSASRSVSDPRNVESMVNLALVQKAAGRPADARDLLRRAVAIDPRNAGSHYNLAVVADESGDKATAIEHYRAFLKLGTVHIIRRMADHGRRDRRPPPRRPHVSPVIGFQGSRARPRRVHLRRSGARSRGVLGAICGRARVVAPLGPRPRLAAAARQVVRRRHAERQRQLPRPPRPRRRAATRPRSSGKASRAIAARSPISISSARCRRSPTS